MPVLVVPDRPDPGTEGCTARQDKTWRWRSLAPLPDTIWVDALLSFDSCQADLLSRNLNNEAILFGIAAGCSG